MAGRIALWSSFLSRWALATVGAVLALLVAFGGGVGFDASLPPAYAELVQASRRPEAYRVAMLFDALNWMMLCGLFLGFASLFWETAPIRALLIAAAGAGMIAGVIGAMLRLQGTGQLAVAYASAPPEAQDSLVQSYLRLADQIGAHFQAGQLLQAVAFLLVASVGYATAGFPRWLAVLAALPGLSSAFLFIRNTTEPFSFPALMIHVLLSVVLYLAIAWRFRQKGIRAASYAVTST